MIVLWPLFIVGALIILGGMVVEFRRIDRDGSRYDFD